MPANEEGRRLFVGRSTELRRLRLLLSSAATHPTIEGENGVGKTSLVAIAGYEARQQFEQGHTTQLLMPMPEAFQITPGVTVESFVRRLYFLVAQAFIDNHDLLKRAGLPVPDTDAVRRWLNSPIFTLSGGSLYVLGSGASASRSSSPNTGAGFTEVGFQACLYRCSGLTTNVVARIPPAVRSALVSAISSKRDIIQP